MFWFCTQNLICPVVCWIKTGHKINLCRLFLHIKINVYHSSCVTEDFTRDNMDLNICRLAVRCCHTLTMFSDCFVNVVMFAIVFVFQSEILSYRRFNTSDLFNLRCHMGKDATLSCCMESTLSLYNCSTRLDVDVQYFMDVNCFYYGATAGSLGPVCKLFYL